MCNDHNRPTSLPDLVSPQQLADYLGVPVGAIYAWNHYGTGPKRLKIGRHVRYRRIDIERWLTERETEQ